MITRSYFFNHPALSIVILIILLCSPDQVNASSLSGAVKGLEINHISTFSEMKTALLLLQTSHFETIKKDIPNLKLQQLIIEKSGDGVSRIVYLFQVSKQSNKTKKETASKLFALNNKIISSILETTRQKVEHLQETRLDDIKDTTAFFTSTEWQQLQYIISLSSYWLSWNSYYWCTLLPDQENCSIKMLPQAVKGFSRSFIDFREESIITRSLFGRALCYKQMRKYDKAIQDINSVIKRINPNDNLYFRVRYEKILISYLSGNFESAIMQLNNFQEESTMRKITADFNVGISKLKIKINLALLNANDEKDKRKLKELYYNILNDLKLLTELDEDASGELYNFVKDNIDLFGSLSNSRLGPVGSLAVADGNFNNKNYEKAITQYRNLYEAKNNLIKKRKDDLSFRIGYSFCQMGDWNEALKIFTTFLKNYPSSNLLDKSACTYYFAASNSYKETPTKKTYGKYINAIKIYLEHCSDPENKSEAHFQLGKYYLEEDDKLKAAGEFLKVEKKSQNYIQARYYVVRSNIDILERYNNKNLSQSKKAIKLYRETTAQLEEFRTLFNTQKNIGKTNELELHSAILLAKLYIYGPEKTLRKGLKALAGLETRFSKKNNKTLFISAVKLKMECYRKLNMFIEAKEEIIKLTKPADLDFHTWSLINEFGNGFYNTSVALRNENKIEFADKHAELAIMIYQKLSLAAANNTSYNNYNIPIQLRLAELYRDINKTETAKKIYLDNLKQNPDSADAIYNLGLISEQQGQWEEALKTWRKFSDGVKNGSHYWYESRYHTAKALYKLGQIKNACEILSMTIILHPELRDNEFKIEFMKLKNNICSNLKISD